MICQIGGHTDMETETIEPKKIIYIDHTGDHFFVWLNTSHDSHLENSFENYEDAVAFAQAWTDGIMAKDGTEWDVVLTEALEVNRETEAAAEAAQDFISALMPIFQLFSKTMPTFINSAIAFKRLYLSSTYAYNLLSRCRFLVKSPKIVSRVISIFMWMFMRLPEKLILWWPMPELRD